MTRNAERLIARPKFEPLYARLFIDGPPPAHWT